MWSKNTQFTYLLFPALTKCISRKSCSQICRSRVLSLAMLMWTKCYPNTHHYVFLLYDPWLSWTKEGRKDVIYMKCDFGKRKAGSKEERIDEKQEKCRTNKPGNQSGSEWEQLAASRRTLRATASGKKRRKSSSTLCWHAQKQQSARRANNQQRALLVFIHPFTHLTSIQPLTIKELWTD